MAVFKSSEYLHRIARTKRRMEEIGADVLLITDPANINWLSGYDGYSFYVPQALILALDHSEPLWVGRGIDANGAKLTAFLDHDNIIGYPDDYVHSDTKHPAEFMAREIARRGWGSRTIGLDMESFFFSPRAYEQLKTSLPEANFVSDGRLVNWLRSTKSPEEIAVMRQAARILERVMEVAIDSVRIGTRQCDAAAAIYQAEISGTAEFGGDYTGLVPMLPTGLGASAPHMTWSDRKFVTGEATILEVAGCRFHYHCPMSRTVFLGHPPAAFERAGEVALEGLEAALAVAQPGALCETVEAAWTETLTKRGVSRQTSRVGYPIGLGYPPDWGEQTMSFRPGDKTVLVPGMTFHLLPGIWMDSWGIEISETILITETTAEVLADVPRPIVVKP